jgi:hypothetical protein
MGSGDKEIVFICEVIQVIQIQNISKDCFVAALLAMTLIFIKS